MLQGASPALYACQTQASPLGPGRTRGTRGPVGLLREPCPHTVFQVVGEESSRIRAGRDGQDVPSGLRKSGWAPERGRRIERATCEAARQCVLSWFPQLALPLGHSPYEATQAASVQAFIVGEEASRRGSLYSPCQLPMPPHLPPVWLHPARYRLSSLAPMALVAAWPYGCELWPGIQSSVGCEAELCCVLSMSFRIPCPQCPLL